MLIREHFFRVALRVNARDDWGDTPLQYTRRKDVAELLLSNNAQIDSKDDDGGRWRGGRSFVMFGVFVVLSHCDGMGRRRGVAKRKVAGAAIGRGVGRLYSTPR